MVTWSAWAPMTRVLRPEVVTWVTCPHVSLSLDTSLHLPALSWGTAWCPANRRTPPRPRPTASSATRRVTQTETTSGKSIISVTVTELKTVRFSDRISQYPSAQPELTHGIIDSNPRSDKKLSSPGHEGMQAEKTDVSWAFFLSIVRCSLNLFLSRAHQIFASLWSIFMSVPEMGSSEGNLLWRLCLIKETKCNEMNHYQGVPIL